MEHRTSTTLCETVSDEMSCYSYLHNTKNKNRQEYRHFTLQVKLISYINTACFLRPELFAKESNCYLTQPVFSDLLGLPLPIV